MKLTRTITALSEYESAIANYLPEVVRYRMGGWSNSDGRSFVK
ncbi:hypothetical protein [Microcoleus sp. CAWBG58]|nr:hypothetical protein [Microcoleus sp. CAWBG58]